MLKHQRTLCRFIEKLHRRFDRKPIFMVEVGVFRGATSAALLGRFPFLDLTLVDPWDSAPPYRDLQITPEMMRDAKAETIRRIAPYAERCRVLACCSDQAAWLFDDKTQHLIFVDGDHSLEAVRNDIMAWKPKVIDGGILCGHDYQRWQRGVRRAVDELVPDRSLWNGGVWATVAM